MIFLHYEYSRRTSGIEKCMLFEEAIEDAEYRGNSYSVQLNRRI